MTLDSPPSIFVEEWDHTHPQWAVLWEFIAQQEQTQWASSQADWHLSSHFLTAIVARQIAGFLRFVTQIIGIEEDHDPIMRDNILLIEAKILAFAVDKAYRRQGIGRALQHAALASAKRYGCYQVRSHSSGINVANHQLKLSMGFAMQPIIRGTDKGGVYFIMPLSSGFHTNSPD